MKKLLLSIVAIILLLILVSDLRLYEGLEGEETINLTELENMSITTVYDNYQSDPELKTGWGFSCLIRTENERILFDTGEDAQSLLGNMEELEINPKNIHRIFLSHRHWDHVGGLEGFLEENSDVTVYLLESFPGTLKGKIRRFGTNLSEIEGPEKITAGVISTGPLRGSPQEQSLIASTNKGLVVITGCAHPGIIKIVKKSKQITGQNVYLVMGGFHLGGSSNKKIKEIVNSFREMGVERVAPCHCSGNRARELFKKEYGEDYIDNGAGKKIDI